MVKAAKSSSKIFAVAEAVAILPTLGLEIVAITVSDTSTSASSVTLTVTVVLESPSAMENVVISV